MEAIAHILPFFALVGVGWAAARGGALTPEATGGLSRYVYWIGFPSLLLHTLAAAPSPGPGEARGLLAYAAALALPYAAALGAASALGWAKEVRAALPLAAGAGNDAFLGAPLVLSALGPAAAAHVGPLLATNWALVVPFGVAALHRGARGGTLHHALRGALFNPVTVAALAGVALMALLPHHGATPAWPAPVEAVVAGLAASSSPVALVALGAVTAFEGLRPASGDAVPVGAGVALRLLLAPALAFALTTLAGAPAPFRAAAVVLAGCPTAVTAFIQAQGYGVWGRGAAQVVVASTLVSALTLTALLALLGNRPA
jgi:malonate transporter and related proteins